MGTTLNSELRCLKIIDTFRFIELDGEWAIQLMAQNCESPSDDDIRSTLSGFRDWVAEIICGTPAYQMPYCSSLKINNNDLAFVLDELESVKGIMFPASTSLIIKKESEPRMGINLVISGPPGVGKSTLAMELAMRCKPWIKGIIDGGIIRSISAYYSLEQPRETIRSLANDIGIKNDSIVDLFLDPIIENHDNALESSYVEIYKSLIKRNPKSLLLLPILSPRAFVGNQEEERLYWFRYKQIARLLEAARYTSANDAMLTTVVLDNLNAFARHALARQRIHQLFKLIAWAGTLGIYIIEHNPAEEFRSFITEVEALADIVIRLDWEGKDYRFKVMEVLKSRCQRNVLGIHPYKISRYQPTGGGAKREDHYC